MLMEIDISPYLKIPVKTSKYTLVGVGNHHGSLDGGHYFAYVKSISDSKWREFNDSYVQTMNYIEPISSSAITLMYLREDLLNFNQLFSEGIYKKLTLLSRLSIK